MTGLGKLTDYEDVRRCDLAQTLERSAGLVPDKVALVYEDLRITYKELNDRADAFAASLQGLGIVKGDRVAIDLANCPELMVSYYAACKLGAIVVWCNPLYRADEFRFLVSNSRSSAVILHKEFKGYDYLSMLRSMRAGAIHESPLLQLKHAIAVGGGSERDVLDFDQLVRQGWGQRYQRAEIDPENDLAMLLYTGGTTGTPKGAIHTHEVCIQSSAIGIPLLDIRADDVFLAHLPLHHAFGVATVANLSVESAGTIVLMSEYKTELALQLIEEQGRGFWSPATSSGRIEPSGEDHYDVRSG